MILCTDEGIMQKVGQAERLWLFLDYDGTLADFAATPDEIIPDEELITLINHLTGEPTIRLTIISGRRLAHIQSLVPVPGFLKAGSYGLELQNADGEIIHRADYDKIRPLLDDLKQQWGQLLSGRRGFYLEDKGWTLAIHGKDAAEADTNAVFPQARRLASALLEKAPGEVYRLQGGHRFLECGPRIADKKQTVEHIVSAYPWHDNALLIYLGDDDKDEVAFAAIQEHGGMAVAVGDRLLDSAADCWLPSPQSARRWLQMIANRMPGLEEDL